MSGCLSSDNFFWPSLLAVLLAVPGDSSLSLANFFVDGQYSFPTNGYGDSVGILSGDFPVTADWGSTIGSISTVEIGLHLEPPV
jgi:hypothetical protein